MNIKLKHLITHLTKTERAAIVGLLAIAVLLYLWFGKTASLYPTRHVTAVVEKHKQEVKHLEQNIEQIRKETDSNMPKVESLDIDPLVDWLNGWLLSREEDRREPHIDY